LGFTALALLAAPSAAQKSATITGIVGDGTTGAPVVGATVAIPALNVVAITDSAGAFTLTGVAEGTYEWVIAAFGYVPLQQESMLRDGDHFRAGLLPRPLELEGLVVTVPEIDRVLERRQRAAGTSVQLYTREQIQRSGLPLAEMFVTQRARLVLCPMTLGSDGLSDPTAASSAAAAAQEATQFQVPACVRSRGRTVAAKVYLNDRLTTGGVLELLSYHSSELYAVEIRNAGREIRVFTNAFMSRVAQGKANLHPIPPIR
jgi:hypothetical protein